MRWLLGLVPFAIAAACGGTIAPNGSDAGNDAPTTSTKCSSVADCPKGYECAYPMADGCGAARRCFPPAPLCKKLVTSCSCDLTTTVNGDCNDAFQQPVTGMPCPDNCGGVACEVCDVSGFAPSIQAVPENATKACSPADISAFVTACLASSATQATCSSWQQADAGACAACIITQKTSASWGPIVCDQAGCILDDGGCVDILAGQVPLEQASGGKGSCGDLVTARDGCIDYACGTCTASNDFTTCQSDALGNQCKSYSDATSTSPLCTSIDAGTSVCGPQGESDYAAFINVFCGSGN